MARIGCLLVRDFPLAAVLRANPELKDHPFAITRGEGARAELICVSAQARRFGVGPGMTVAQATAIAPDLLAIGHSESAERAASDALLDVGQSLSPVIEDGGPGLVYLDLSGLSAIFADERELASEAARRALRVGMQIEVGIASTREVANLAARCGGTRIIEAGREREFLSWLPLELLRLDPAFETTLTRWGIKRLGELARLDPRELSTRLGARGVELVRLARGESGRPMAARAQSELFAERAEFDYGIESLEPLAFIMRGLLDRIVARLEIRGLVAGDLIVSLGLADRRCDDRRVQVSAPTNEVKSLLALLSLSLEKNPPPAAVEAVQISACPNRRRPAQNDLFLPPAPAPERLQATIARLAALCGPDHVGTLRPDNSHRPEATQLANFLTPSPAQNCHAQDHHEKDGHENGAAHNFSRIVLRSMNPAEEVEMLCNRGQPEFIRGTSVCARVVSIAGPWRRDGEWWSENRYARDYYDLVLADGGVYRAFCDRRSDKWFIDGIYD